MHVLVSILGRSTQKRIYYVGNRVQRVLVLRWLTRRIDEVFTNTQRWVHEKYELLNALYTPHILYILSQAVNVDVEIEAIFQVKN